MSTGTTTDGPNPVEVLHEDVFGDPRICNNCFRQFKDVAEPPSDAYWNGEHSYRTRNSHSSQTLRDIVTRRTVRATTDGTVVNGHVYTDWRNRPETRARPAWVCKACGIIDGASADETLSTAEAIAAGDRLVAYVHAHGVACDRDAVLDTIRAAKADPDRASRDTEIFEHALGAGFDTATEQ